MWPTLLSMQTQCRATNPNANAKEHLVSSLLIGASCIFFVDRQLCKVNDDVANNSSSDESQLSIISGTGWVPIQISSFQ